MADFEPDDHFYLRIWARDLKPLFPFLDEQRVEHPYELFYYLWKLSYWYGRKYADYSICFEALAQSPVEELQKLFRFLEIHVDSKTMSRLSGLIQMPRLGKWKVYAKDEWFRDREARCDRILMDFFSQPET